METIFKKVHTAKDLTVSAIVIAAGAVLMLLNKGLGICILFFGLAMLFIWKSGFKKDGRGVVLSKKSMDLCASCRPSVMQYLEGGNNVPEIKEGSEGGSVLLDVYYSKDGRLAYAQLMDFSNYAYQPATDVVELRSDRAEKLIGLLK